mmetsp:Transcript_17453/g.52731  ORF Transcript_17453/g.52731 Transcript_17453/m.52731 type:complete len:238 (-) Transcript_17453:391-1104(-)
MDSLCQSKFQCSVTSVQSKAHSLRPRDPHGRRVALKHMWRTAVLRLLSQACAPQLVVETGWEPAFGVLTEPSEGRAWGVDSGPAAGAADPTLGVQRLLLGADDKRRRASRRNPRLAARLLLPPGTRFSASAPSLRGAAGRRVADAVRRQVHAVVVRLLGEEREPRFADRACAHRAAPAFSSEVACAGTASAQAQTYLLCRLGASEGVVCHRGAQRLRGRPRSCRQHCHGQCALRSNG